MPQGLKNIIIINWLLVVAIVLASLLMSNPFLNNHLLLPLIVNLALHAKLSIRFIRTYIYTVLIVLGFLLLLSLGDSGLLFLIGSRIFTALLIFYFIGVRGYLGVEMQKP